jgi:DNA-directed RNA polymerase subunit beta'
MVLPPDLRPMLQLDGGRYAASDLNDLYRRLIYRNNRLRKLIQIGAPEVIQRNEKRMLQEAVEALIDNSVRNGKQVMASSGIKRPLRSLTDALKGKQGRFRQNLLGKRVDYSGRTVIIVGPTLKLDECGLPKEMALELFKPFLIGRIIAKSEKGLLTEQYQCYNIHSARRLIESKVSIVYDILDEVIKDKYVLLNRAPTLHRLGFLAFKPVLIEGKAIQIHPMVCKGFNADFDGDQMGVHLPITLKGQEEARNLMSATKNLLKPAHGKLIMQGGQDIILGLYYLTYISDENNDNVKNYSSFKEVLFAHALGLVKTNQKINIYTKEKGLSGKVSTSVGRIIFNNCFPENVPFINEVVNGKKYDQILSDLFHVVGQEQLSQVIDKIKDTMFEYVTKSGISISANDLVRPVGKEAIIEETQNKVNQIQTKFNLGFLSEEGKHKQIINLWRESSENILELTSNTIEPINNIGMMVFSGARGNKSQVNYMSGMRGLTVTTSGDIIELPAVHGYLDGLSPLEYFVTMKGHRKGMAGTALQTADAGYLTRRLVDVAQNIIITADECGTSEGVLITKESSALFNKKVHDRIYGRYLAGDIVFEGKLLAKTGELVNIQLLEKLLDYDIDNVLIRSVTKCDMSRGVCQHCYGIDFSTHDTVKMGTAVGVIGAQSLGEPATQLAVSSVKQGVAIGAKSDITSGLPRLDEILEGRTPKYIAPVSSIDGVVEKIEGTLDQGYKIYVKAHNAATLLPFDSTKDNLIDSINDGAKVNVGDMIASTESGEAVFSSANGILEITTKGLVVKQAAAELEEHTTPSGIYLKVKKGETVKKGQIIAEGGLELQSILDIAGFDSLLEYVISEMNYIYLSNGIEVDEKHIEIIIKQMCTRAYIIDPGDSEFITGDTVRISTIKATNKKLVEDGKNQAIYKRVVSGISRTSLSTDSFLSAASFQETARVLVEAALSCKKDFLLGLKENVILGQLIPCGTGFDQQKISELTDKVEEFDELELADMVE